MIPLSAVTRPTLEGSIWRYRVMSWIVGAMLLFLCVVAIPLQYAYGHPGLADVGFTIHGILYIVYLLSAADLGRRARFSFGQLVQLVCAGFLPGLAFYTEHKVYSRIADRYRAGELS